MAFPLLMTADGQAFLRECRAAGKEVCVWTVNDPSEMKVGLSWGIKAILTDKVGAFVRLRKEVRFNAVLVLNTGRRRPNQTRLERTKGDLFPLVLLAVLHVCPRNSLVYQLGVSTCSRPALPFTHRLVILITATPLYHYRSSSGVSSSI